MTKAPAKTASAKAAVREPSAAGVGQRLIEAREDKQLTRPALAKLAKVPYPTLAGLENGDQSTSTHIPALASALGVSALWLATGKTPKHVDGSEPAEPAEAPATAHLDPRLLSRTHAFLAADHPYDLGDPGEAALFASAYEWLGQQDEVADSPRAFNKFLRWAAMRNLTAQTTPATDQPKGSAAMSRWRNSLTEYASTEKELTEEPARKPKLSTK